VFRWSITFTELDCPLSSARTLQPKNVTKFLIKIQEMYPSLDSIESINRYKTDAIGLHLWPEMEKKFVTLPVGHNNKRKF